MPRAEDQSAEIEAVRRLLLDHLWTVEKLSDACTTFSYGAFTYADFERQMLYAIPSPLLIDCYTKTLAKMSLCDECATMHTMKPKMLTCAGCKDSHYCDKACQKKHWRRTHKAKCTKTREYKLETRVLAVCRKMLALMSMRFDDENDLRTNYENSYLMKHIKKNPSNDYIYIAAILANDVVYVPAPEKVFGYLFAMSVSVENAPPAQTVKNRGKVLLMTPTKLQDKQGKMRVVVEYSETFISLP